MNGTNMIQITEMQAQIISRIIEEFTDSVNYPLTCLFLRQLKEEIDTKIAEHKEVEELLKHPCNSAFNDVFQAIDNYERLSKKTQEQG